MAGLITNKNGNPFDWLSVLLSRCCAGALVAALSLFVIAAPLNADDAGNGLADLRNRQHLTGDWRGLRSRLEDSGVTIRSRLTQFFQGMPRGDGDNNPKFGGKFDLMVRTDLARRGFWEGLSLTVKAEYNFGLSVNGFGGTIVPVNTALLFPGLEGWDAVDITNFYFTQTFGGSGALTFGKINMVDVSAAKRFAGGAGINSFWNITFTAPPSGLVPPYLFGALMSYKTPSANYGLWVYDPVDCVNKSCLESPFSEGVTVRGSIELPRKIAGLDGHYGIVALYSNYAGTDLRDLGEGALLPGRVNPNEDGLLLPDFGGPGLGTLDQRYYFAFTFDQYLYRSLANPKEGVGLFGQFGISDGNPTRLFWSAHIGLGGTGLISGRSQDTWGAGYYYYSWSNPLKDALSRKDRLRNEQGFEIFYNYEVMPWLTVGADLQVAETGAGDATAVFTGLRSVIEF
ncbi:MAG: carbohydrate porin [Hyphomicrobiaceae bacterium]